MPFLDFDAELKRAIEAASSLYGEPVSKFTFLPVEYHDKNYAQTIVYDGAATIAVKLANPAVFANDDYRTKGAIYQLWHEAVHCLAPENRMDTLWFEEGVAIRFCQRKAPVERRYLVESSKHMKRPWSTVRDKFAQLNPTDAQIRAARERAEGRFFDNITEELIVEECDARKNLAADLCRRLPKDSR
jgi:hypothetical protein